MLDNSTHQLTVVNKVNQTTQATYERQTKFGLVQVVTEGLSRIFVNGIQLNTFFLCEEKAIASASKDSRIKALIAYTDSTRGAA
jgi:hypothetical protein